jgi:hypothetical protein
VGIQVGDTAEEARYAVSSFTYTVTAGSDITERPELSGGAFFICLSSTGASRWALEAAKFERTIGGTRRPV